MISSIHLILASVLAGCVTGSPAQFNSRIIGGQEAILGQFSFQVGLQIHLEGGKSTCGGALISPKYVITAAHCVSIVGIEAVDVHFGTLNIKDEEDGHRVITVPKENLKPHEEYDPYSILNDIALIELPEEVELSENIQPIELPHYSHQNVDLEGKVAVASGWGRFSDASSQISPVLRYAEVRVENQSVCHDFFSNLLPSMVCTSTLSGSGTCHGDSGGPLAYEETAKKPILIGLTSFGNGYQCVAAGWPSVFTRITSFLDWIGKTSGIEIKP